VSRLLHGLLGLPGRLVDGLWGAARPVDLPEVTTAAAAGLVARSPRGNAYLALEPSLRRARIGEGLLAYRVAARNAFIVGGLHGPLEAAARGLVELRERLRGAGVRRVVVVPVSTDEVGVVQEAGFGVVQVASEALVDPRTFGLTGGALADLRQMVNRATGRFDLTVREIRPETEGTPWARVYERWLASRPSGHAMSLLVGSPAVDEPLGRRYFAAVEPGEGGRLVAVTSIAPGWGGRGFGVDIMAREPDAPAGAMDLLLAEVIGTLGDEGVEILSLGACPMAGIEADGHTPRWLRALFRFLYASKLGNRVFPFRQLHRFKAKFAPRWEPVYLAGWPSAGPWTVYVGGRMWGLFGPPA